MKLRGFISVLFIALLLAPASFGQIGGGPGNIAYITFDQAAFNQSLTDAVASNVMGYQYVLIKNGQMVTEGAGGLAQNYEDGYAPMTTSTPTNIGSLAKFLSGTAMLNLMVKDAGPGGAWDQGLTLNQKLDRPFTTIVPNVWLTGNKSGIDTITLRELLQHKSGFDADKATGGRTVLDYLKDSNGFYTSQHGTREYANINFVLNGYLLYMYEYPSAKNTFNTLINGFNLDQAGADAYVRNASGNAMHTIMKTRIWDNMTPTINPNCDAANKMWNSAAYYYSSKDAIHEAGGISSHIDSTGHCGGEGGYYMSMRDLANYMAHFSATDLIVNNEARNLMFSDTMANPDNRLVWTSSTADAWSATNFNVPNIASSNGIGDDSLGRGYRAVIIRLPQKYYLVMATNSPDVSASSLFWAGLNAFKAGMQHNF